ncbi:MAG: phytoene/squalene synthase family protein [Alkalispirochaeta sp.]
MEMAAVHRETFREGSKTYFNSTRFFPEPIRTDVFLLYGFVRTADNYVDAIPQDAEGFENMVATYYAALSGTPADDPIIDGFVELSRRYEFEERWTEAFLKAMRMDLYKRVHATLEESLEYMYGSAEVIGLFMGKIMGLSTEASHAARLLGRAMQYINFIRDIAEDNTFGRTYLPITETTLPDVSREHAEADPEEFNRFIRAQLHRYLHWQAEAEAGYDLIPRRYRIPIKTAGDMYKWTGQVIYQNPSIVFERKVKPRRSRIVMTGLLNALTC